MIVGGVVKKSVPTVMSVSEPLLLYRRKPTSIVGCWNLCISLVVGSSVKLSNHFIISRCVWLQTLLLILHSFNCYYWEDHKVVVQTNQGQPSYLFLFYIVALFFLTRICYCVNIYCQELEFVGVHYYWKDCTIVVISIS